MWASSAHGDAITRRVYLFVGERPSPTAAAAGWSWESNRVCALTLARALHDAGIESGQQRFVNLWTEPGLGRPGGPPCLEPVRAAVAAGDTIVALGRLVQAALLAAEVPHLYLIHPAARGAIRLRARYHQHVREVLA